MRMASNGQRSAHRAQPVQPASSSSVEVLRPAPACKDSTCGSHTATHQPQPVQRAGSIRGGAPSWHGPAPAHLRPPTPIDWRDGAAVHDGRIRATA